MFDRIYNLWQILRGTLWFTPALFCLTAVAVIAVLYQIEAHYLSKKFTLPALLYNGTMKEARDLIVVLVPAIITMTTLVISVTIVVLSLASSQLGPRLIKSFMSSHKTQNYIGLFFGAIVSCFIVLRILYDENLLLDTPPRLTISFVIFYAFASLFVLLFFVNHVAESCIADNAIKRVSNDLMDTIDRLTPMAQDTNDAGNERGRDSAWPKDFDRKAACLYFKHSGYIQTIDYGRLLTIAKKHKLRIDTGLKAGQFIIAGQNGIRVYPKNLVDDEVEKEISNTVVLGSQRTPTQDPEYSMRHLIEIALRALSPGINDPFTAVTVIDHLSMGLSRFFEHKNPHHYCYDEENVLRVKGIPVRDADIIDMAYNQIRQAGKNRPDISIHLLRNIANIAPLACREEEKTALRKQAVMVKEQTQRETLHENDYKAILREYKKAVRNL